MPKACTNWAPCPMGSNPRNIRQPMRRLPALCTSLAIALSMRPVTPLVCTRQALRWVWGCQSVLSRWASVIQQPQPLTGWRALSTTLLLYLHLKKVRTPVYSGPALITSWHPCLRYRSLCQTDQCNAHAKRMRCAVYGCSKATTSPNPARRLKRLVAFTPCGASVGLVQCSSLWKHGKWGPGIASPGL